jgi:hypothetical protein
MSSRVISNPSVAVEEGKQRPVSAANVNSVAGPQMKQKPPRSRSRCQSQSSDRPNPRFISSGYQFDRDNANLEQMRKYWMSAAPFPVICTRSAMLQWLIAIGWVYANDTEARQKHFAPEPTSMVAEELLLQAPDKITLDIFCYKSDLRDVTFASPLSADDFIEGLNLFGRPDYIGNKDWKSYRKWLLEQPGDCVMISTVSDCFGKHDLLSNAIDTSTKGLGIYLFVGNAEISNFHEFSTPFTNWWKVR